MNQDGDHPLELIIVDDSSADGTVRLIQQLYGSDPRVRLIACERNVGPGEARNQGLATAGGEWIALIDADDAWTENRLSRLLPLCTAEVDVLFDNLIGYDEPADVVTGLLFACLPASMTIAAMAADRVRGSKFNYGYLKPLIRRDFLRRTDSRYPEVRISEDLLFYLELLIKGARTKTTDEGFYLYTTSFGQVSGRSSALSSTVPNDELVANSLDSLAARYRHRLDHEDLDAISGRADRLRQYASLNCLYDKWKKRRYFAAARQFLADPPVRKQLAQALVRRVLRAR